MRIEPLSAQGLDHGDGLRAGRPIRLSAIGCHSLRSVNGVVADVERNLAHIAHRADECPRRRGERHESEREDGRRDTRQRVLGEIDDWRSAATQQRITPADIGSREEVRGRHVASRGTTLRIECIRCTSSAVSMMT